MFAYEPPSTKEVLDEEFLMDMAAEVFNYPLNEAFPADNYDNNDNVAFFGIFTALSLICCYYMRYF